MGIPQPYDHSELLEVGEYFKTLGAHLLPIKPHEKIPALGNHASILASPQTVNTLKSDLERAQRIHQSFGRINIATYTGAPSKNLAAIDIDQPKVFHNFLREVEKSKPKAYKLLTKIQNNALIYETASHTKGNPRRHLVFQTELPVASRVLIHTQGFEIRSQPKSGPHYVVVPPSLVTLKPGQQGLYRFVTQPKGLISLNKDELALLQDFGFRTTDVTVEDYNLPRSTVAMFTVKPFKGQDRSAREQRGLVGLVNAGWSFEQACVWIKRVGHKECKFNERDDNYRRQSWNSAKEYYEKNKNTRDLINENQRLFPYMDYNNYIEYLVMEKIIEQQKKSGKLTVNAPLRYLEVELNQSRASIRRSISGLIRRDFIKLNTNLKTMRHKANEYFIAPEYFRREKLEPMSMKDHGNHVNIRMDKYTVKHDVFTVKNGLGKNGLLAYGWLEQCGQLSISELTKKTRIPSKTVYRIVSKMIHSGLVNTVKKGVIELVEPVDLDTAARKLNIYDRLIKRKERVRKEREEQNNKRSEYISSLK